MREEVSKRITKFFHDFWQAEATVLDLKAEGEGINVLCGLPDGEYQVTLNGDLSVRAFYRKKPYVMETKKEDKSLSHQTETSAAAPGDNAKRPPVKPLKRPVLSNSEKELLLLVKKQPGMTSYEIRQHVDIKFTMLLPILKKLVALKVIQKQNDKYFPL